MGLNSKTDDDTVTPDPARAHILRAATLSGILIVLLQSHEAICSAFDCNRDYVILGFGLIVLSAWLYGWKSLAYFLPGILLQAVMEGYSPSEMMSSADGHVLLVTICAPFAFTTMRWAGIDTEIDLSGCRRVWRLILLAGIMASAFALVLRSLLWDLFPTYAISFSIAYPTVLSDIAGLALFMLILIGIFKLIQQSE